MFASKANDVLRIKKLNTLFISYDGMTDSLGQSQVLPYLIGLSKSGYSISIISCEKETAVRKNGKIIAELLAQHRIEWHPLLYTKKPPVLSTLWDIRKIKRKIRALHQQKKFVLVHCRSYITSLVGVSFCKANAIPFVFDMRGFWADERVEGNIWNLKKPLFNKIYKFFKKKELEFVNEASAIVSLTHAGKREIQSWKINASQKNKIYVIPCSADFDLFAIATDSEKAAARERVGFLKSDFVLCYLGSLGTWYLLPEMCAFFKALKKEIPHAKFYFLTADSKETVEKELRVAGISLDDTYIESAQRNEVPKRLAAADWGISFIKPSYSKTASSPTKMGEMLAMGIPLVVNDKVGDVAEICEQTQSGFWLHDFTPEEYLRVLDKIKAGINKSQLSIREASYKIYGLEAAVETYVRIYKNCLSPLSNE